MSSNFCISGGLRKISALHHSNGFDIPKRSRQIIWRAAVEMSNSTPRLALQVCLIVPIFTFWVCLLWFAVQ